MKNSQEETDIEKLRDLCRRWNRAASMAGYIGSEFYDEPENVFGYVRARSDSQRELIFRMVKEERNGRSQVV
jgi:hypothetical protein